MAIIPSSHFPPSRVNAGSTEYPQGSAKDETSSGANDGTPAMQASVWNDIWGFLQKLLSVAGITPSGDPDDVTDSDYWDALTSNDVKAELARVDGVSPYNDLGVQNTGLGISYLRNAVGVFGVPDVRTDYFPATGLSWTETSGGSKIWYSSGANVSLPTLPVDAQILSVSLEFKMNYTSPTRHVRHICPANGIRNESDDANCLFTMLYVMSRQDPSHADASDHGVFVTYVATGVTP